MNRRAFAFVAAIGISECIPAQSSLPKGSPRMEQNEDEFDPPLTAAESGKIEQLSASEVAQIDQTLLANAAPQWRKVARVVGTSMTDLKSKVSGIPDVYYSQRVAKLVSEGQLESQGNLRRMRFSEVRLPNK